MGGMRTSVGVQIHGIPSFRTQQRMKETNDFYLSYESMMFSKKLSNSLDSSPIFSVCTQTPVDPSSSPPLMDIRTGFSDSNDIISGSSGIESPLLPSDVSALNRLSETLESILLEPANTFADAKIILSGGREVPVHRCILAKRSLFFKNKFCEKDHNVKLEMKELASDCEIGFDSLMSVLNYVYSGKIKGLPKDVCVCVDEECCHEACRPAVDFMVEVIYAFHVFQITEMVALWQRRLLDILDKASVDDILVVLSIANTCGKSCEELYLNASTF
ncbi:hypothetical protein L1987_14117 [Smallanthus sonchifolius]|uniref:Uncharacterized protein n=1 Tax=Smallanthus sonchifolius TaxID=185202 RepID=A0ACB9J2B4_9ASTR|nr:hypothetical protein L1987_14117 [Smallanthus sonchifolius]